MEYIFKFAGYKCIYFKYAWEKYPMRNSLSSLSIAYLPMLKLILYIPRARITLTHTRANTNNGLVFLVSRFLTVLSSPIRGLGPK